MASTGEVACFGKDKYEAYIKALLATAFSLPKKNILLSIGSFKEKTEFLPSARKLHQMGYKVLFRSCIALASFAALFEYLPFSSLPPLGLLTFCGRMTFPSHSWTCLRLTSHPRKNIAFLRHWPPNPLICMSIFPQ